MPRRLATVWLFHAEGRAAAGHDNAERAWTEAHALPPRSAERSEACSRLTPVEIHINPALTADAVARWERVAGQPGVCHVDVYDREPWMSLNRYFEASEVTR